MICKPLSRSGVLESTAIVGAFTFRIIGYLEAAQNLSCQSPPAGCLTYFYYGDLIIRPTLLIGRMNLLVQPYFQVTIQ